MQHTTARLDEPQKPRSDGTKAPPTPEKQILPFTIIFLERCFYELDELQIQSFSPVLPTVVMNIPL